jgi:hypothetical protein
MPESVYCLGCGAAFPIDADPYPLNGGMCGPCIAEQRQRPWQIIAENERLRDALRRIRDHGETHDEPCWAIHNGDCADTMQEIARAALDAR